MYLYGVGQDIFFLFFSLVSFYWYSIWVYNYIYTHVWNGAKQNVLILDSFILIVWNRIGIWHDEFHLLPSNIPLFLSLSLEFGRYVMEQFSITHFAIKYPNKRIVASLHSNLIHFILLSIRYSNIVLSWIDVPVGIQTCSGNSINSPFNNVFNSLMQMTR